ncbi:MerR family transcriptional regulator [Amycolatopsis panacis]|uniref:MerR family transcriptional regulator n=1 Tax=Amycolatopsis panacis TaxID=2340917 RepID=A0A419IBE5_9PSEU|nr:MerR family transcriptional regulator [Amycolatopsis panacis]RJQ91276.1 MerR family transcriptional regulator [Amycolatopsis panacis]
MLSSELADVAGVTVRMLRHYHQMGLLPEPPRSAGGYRQYDVGHLVRLLRITRLTALGVPLAGIPAVLDDPAAAERLLDELDRKTAAEIDRLTARRESIAVLRRTGSPPDLPPDLAALRSPGVQEPPMNRHQHEHLLLAVHLLEEAGRAEFMAVLSTSTPAIAPLAARLYALDADTPEDDLTKLVGDMADLLKPMTAELREPPRLDRRAKALLDELSEQNLPPVQCLVLRRVEQRLAQAGPESRATLPEAARE